MTPEEHRDILIEDFQQKFTAKYNAGQEEHGGNLWKKPGMLKNMESEVLDQWAYVQTIRDQLKELRTLLEGRQVIVALMFIDGLLSEEEEV